MLMCQSLKIENHVTIIGCVQSAAIVWGVGCKDINKHLLSLSDHTSTYTYSGAPLLVAMQRAYFCDVTDSLAMISTVVQKQVDSLCRFMCCLCILFFP